VCLRLHERVMRGHRLVGIAEGPAPDLWVDVGVPDYGQGSALTVAAGTHLASLPVQPSQAVKGAPVLILGTRRKKRLAWDGRRGTAACYAGARLGSVSPGRSRT
jgi:hypothetical protein